LSKAGEERGELDISAVMEQLAILRRSIERLEALINELSSMLEDLRRSREAIDKISEAGETEALVPLSSRGAVFAKSMITDSKRFIVHLGGDVYGEMGPEEAMKLLLGLEGEISASLNKLASQYNKEVEQYNALQQVLAAAQRREKQG
jgi:prefoldin alpha subunit